ncbi:MAG: hypothetical protein IKQ85_01760 [Bacteroidaceae bacterium]|nr:hypothetical protein [Bacteroidaceae bacterium]
MKVNVEEKSTLHVELANSPWSVEKDGIERLGFQREEAQNPVKSFRAKSSRRKAQKATPKNSKASLKPLRSLFPNLSKREGEVSEAFPQTSPKERGKSFPLGEDLGEASERVGERLEEILERLASGFDGPFISC